MNDLEAIARKKALEIVSLFRAQHHEAFEAAIFYGTLTKAGPLKPDEPVEFRLLLLDRQRSPQVFGDHGTLLQRAGAMPFTSPDTFLVPQGPLRVVVVKHRTDIEQAAKSLHPEVIALFKSNDILYLKNEEVEEWLTEQFRIIKQQLRRQRIA